MSELVIPAGLRPRDGRFGSGPAKIRDEQLAALGELFGLPGDYTVVLGNGGTSAFWDAAAAGLVRRHAQHLSFGEFSARFAGITARAPWLGAPTVGESAPG